MLINCTTLILRTFFNKKHNLKDKTFQQIGENICHKMYVTKKKKKDVFTIDKELQISKIEANQQGKKMGKNLNKVFTKEDIQMKRYVRLYQSSRKYICLEADLSLMISTHFIQLAGLTAESLDLKSEGCKREEAEAAQSLWR